MQVNNHLTQMTPDQFQVSIKNFSFQERYFKWQSYVKQLKEVQSSYFEIGLERFIENYPFNHTYWTMLIQHILSKPKSKAAAVKMYQTALTKNSRCITLWKNYLMWLKEVISKSDPNYLKGQFEKATKIIGTHYHADFIFEQYFHLQTDVLKKFQAMKKSLVSPLKEIDRIFDLVSSFIDESQQVTVQILEIIAKNQELAITQPKNSDKYATQLRDSLKSMLRKLYEPTKKHVESRYQYESKVIFCQLKLTSDEYKPFEGGHEVWKQYLYFIKNSGNVEFVYPLYERALIHLCDKEALWEDYFLILQSQNNYNRALYLLRSHSTFFENLSRDITYYWLQIQERESPERARDLYIELEKQQSTFLSKAEHLQAYMRHIQLEMRAKEYNNARSLYQTMLTVFASNINIVTYIVIEYAEFIERYFRDLDLAKKLLKDYFQSFAYNEYLFLGYLEFFINHVEYKQNSKDSKEIEEDFVSIICSGLARAYENTPEKYKSLKKIVQKYLRDYIVSIYSIKSAQKKIKETQLNAQKKKDSLKRPFEQM